MKDNLISVIVPVYNVEKYLSDCIDSIINQTYKNFELILVDDGSNDFSLDICNSYRDVDSRIVVIHTSNEGVSNARNIGIQKAKGKYIVFVDSDDTVDEYYLECLINPILKNNYDLVICGHQRVYVEKNKTVGFYKRNPCMTGKFSEDLRFLYPETACILGPVCKIYNADIINEYNIRYPLEINYAEDQIFNYDYFIHIRNVYFVDKVLYNYYIRRKEHKSLSQVTDKKYTDADLYSISKMSEFLVQINAVDKEKIIMKRLCNSMMKYRHVDFFNYSEYIDFVVRRSDLIPNKFCASNIKELVAYITMKYRITYPTYLYFMLKNYIERI